MDKMKAASKLSKDSCQTTGAGFKESARSIGPILLALVVVMVLASSARACGWWGDGEDDDHDAIVIGADGRPVSENKSTNNQSIDRAVEPAMKHTRAPAMPLGLEVPSPRSGYGIVVRQDGSAIPYLQAVQGQSVHTIQLLRRAGFSTVIDLGTIPKVAVLHRRETEALSMQYFNIPIDGDAPDKTQVARFREILSAKGKLPILVFSASANLLGGMWAYYRLAEGVAQEVAIKEGRELGLSKDNVHGIRKRTWN
jgi:protein tyrosine phosphatase (PTP) superfamily phosphohydrolase (DUF442 family)